MSGRMLLESAVENERRNKMRVEIDHVAIRTTEFDKARAFFEDVFSMQCYRQSQIGRASCRERV